MILQKRENGRRNPIRVVYLLLVVLVVFFVEVESASKQWKLEEFPTDVVSEECRSEKGRVCDPDGFLNTEELRQVEDAILKLEQTELSVDIPCSNNNKNNGASKHLEIAIAIVQQMDLGLDGEEDSFEDSILDEVAKLYAESIHNSWGVGSSVECGNGILLFLSIDDRVMYLSVGTSLTQLLSKTRIDSILKDIKPYLREKDYTNAFSDALLKGIKNQIERGSPSFYESHIQPHLELMGILLVFFGIFTFQKHYTDQQRQEYAQVHSQLSQMDRDRAMALMGQYRCTSCPICLESFQQPDNPNNDDDTAIVNGHDGLPIKLLRCGHAFDQSCWDEWIRSGQGDVRKCPICKQDVSSPDSSQTEPLLATDTTTTTATPQQSDASTVYRRSNSPRTTSSISRISMRLYEQERQFRFLQLMHRYPRYISHSQITRWTDSNYSGSSLVRDSEFVRRNPDNPARHGHSSSRSYSSFGGGRSGGGSGGRW